MGKIIEWVLVAGIGLCMIGLLLASFFDIEIKKMDDEQQ
jgi:hypothetical protein